MRVRQLLIVLAAAVIAGLAVYFAFNFLGAFELVGEDVTVHVNTFVVLIACLCLAAAGMSLLLRAVLVRTDRQEMQALEQRIAQLEQDRPSP